MDTAGPHASDATASDVERVVLLDADGTPVGAEPKATVHRNVAEGGTPLHLAFSCHVYSPDGRFLLTRRALGKKAFGGVWTNGFCGHPAVGETPEEAVSRRAPQELGVEVADVAPLLPGFRYRAADAAGVEEHEVCPVFRATLHGDPAPEEDEVAEWCWVGVAELTAALAAVPRAFSPWLVAQWEQGAFDAG
ncbi:isopentenyl-diphosphate Delta-isomerase [Micrococcus sp. EYE_162]|uniref:isopentenyl-diphosphate Delta-isomerase n=1 Tax=unclassified Micrococcus TaxID=2620948 RepID=UPI002003CB40|nr:MULTISPECIES: isopentenyl-diphosphate Delta-isomerase [unclassified Micrococcus]MCK6094986.1 isopentenyl-diphosphate Delta-isomerase [Micrococcus sp. EYE_212]MCK6170933.1 isopentenyl-diphosphate Delta-isomerase [Micrococcus sp. EYE_162]MDX2341680.1 isopentenyl-diphosphate Delta-isomerase [Micrococcus sp. M4NT]